MRKLQSFIFMKRGRSQAIESRPEAGITGQRLQGGASDHSHNEIRKNLIIVYSWYHPSNSWRSRPVVLSKVCNLKSASIVKYIIPSPARPIAIEESSKLNQVIKPVFYELFRTCFYNASIPLRWASHIRQQPLIDTQSGEAIRIAFSQLIFELCE
jgi:hypothetical protein